MTDIPVFVNDRALRVAAGSSISDTVAASDPDLARALAAGAAKLTDGRGIALDPAALVFPGAILRVVVSARKGPPEADADA